MAATHIPSVTQPERTALVVGMLQGARAALDAAETPESVQDVRSSLRVLREVCAAAMRDPNVSPEDVAHARREAEQLALEAAVKLGTMVPEEGASGARTDLGATSATVAEVAKRCGLSRDTLTRYRSLAAAYATKATEFMDIAREAINTGAAVPLGKLIALVKPEKPKSEAPAKPDRPAQQRKPDPAPAPAAPTVAAGVLAAAEQARQEAARKNVAQARATFETDDPIKFIGAAMGEIIKRLEEARRIYADLEPHPMPATRINDREHAHPRDVQLQMLTEFFEDAVESALGAARDAASLDADAIKHLRAQRDKAQAKRKAVS